LLQEWRPMRPNFRTWTWSEMGPTVGQEYILGLFISMHAYLYVSTWCLREACVVGNVWQCRSQKGGSLHCKQMDRAFKVASSLILPSGSRQTTILSTVASNPITLPIITDEDIRRGNSPFNNHNIEPESKSVLAQIRIQRKCHLHADIIAASGRPSSLPCLGLRACKLEAYLTTVSEDFTLSHKAFELHLCP